MAKQERRYWEHIHSKDIYMSIKSIGRVINLRTGQLSLMSISSIGNVQSLDKKTADIIESHYAPPQPSSTLSPVHLTVREKRRRRQMEIKAEERRKMREEKDSEDSNAEDDDYVPLCYRY